MDDEIDLSKLLSTPFGFGLAVNALRVDDFLKDRGNKILQYWCTTKVNLTRRSIVANKILLSSIFSLSLFEVVLKWG